MDNNSSFWSSSPVRRAVTTVITKLFPNIQIDAPSRNNNNNNNNLKSSIISSVKRDGVVNNHKQQNMNNKTSAVSATPMMDFAGKSSQETLEHETATETSSQSSSQSPQNPHNQKYRKQRNKKQINQNVQLEEISAAIPGSFVSPLPEWPEAGPAPLHLQEKYAAFSAEKQQQQQKRPKSKLLERQNKEEADVVRNNQFKIANSNDAISQKRWTSRRHKNKKPAFDPWKQNRPNNFPESTAAAQTVNFNNNNNNKYDQKNVRIGEQNVAKPKLTYAQHFQLAEHSAATVLNHDPKQIEYPLSIFPDSNSHSKHSTPSLQAAENAINHGSQGLGKTLSDLSEWSDQQQHAIDTRNQDLGEMKINTKNNNLNHKRQANPNVNGRKKKKNNDLNYSKKEAGKNTKVGRKPIGRNGRTTIKIADDAYLTILPDDISSSLNTKHTNSNSNKLLTPSRFVPALTPGHTPGRAFAKASDGVIAEGREERRSKMENRKMENAIRLGVSVMPLQNHMSTTRWICQQGFLLFMSGFVLHPLSFI